MFSRLRNSFKYNFNQKTNTRKKNTSANENTIIPIEHKPPITYKEVRKVLLQPSSITRLFTLLTFIAAGGTIYYYIYDWDNTPEKQLEIAKNMIKNKDESIKLDGFNLLNNANAIKRVFSGPVGVTLDPKSLATDSMIKILMNCAGSNNEEVVVNSLVWLYKLTTYSGISEPTKALILKHDPGLELISSKLKQNDYIKSNSWIMASQLLLNFDNNQGISTEKLVEGIRSLASSSNPLAVATGAKLTTKYVKESDLPKDFSNIVLATKSQALDHIIKLGPDQVHEYVEHPDVSKLVGPESNVYSIIGFSLFAGIWGTTLWAISSRTSKAYNLLKTTYDPHDLQQHRDRFLKHRAVGRGVFILLAYDYLASRGLHYTSGKSLSFNQNSPIQTPEDMQNTNTPMSCVYPVVQSLLFYLGTLYLVRTQRFVAVPLLLAGTYFNRDIFKSYWVTKPAATMVESGVEGVKSQADELLKTVSVVKIAASK